MSSHLVRESAIIPVSTLASYHGLEGRLVNLSGDTVELSSSALVPATGVLLDAGDRDGNQAVLFVLGPPGGTIRVKASGTITKGDRLQQGADGTFVTDAGSGARVVVGVALESAVSGDLFEAALHVPVSLS